MKCGFANITVRTSNVHQNIYLMTQVEMIRKHLNRGWSITPLQALEKYGIMRLASRINDLKNEGMIIHSVMVNTGKKRFAKYFIDKKK
jgi:hypothetical protein